MHDIVIGHVWGEVTEAQVEQIGRPEGPFAAVVQIPVERIEYACRERMGYLWPVGPRNRYTVETFLGRYRFRVGDGDAVTVDRALGLMLGRQFDPAVRRRMSGPEKVLLAAVTAVLVCLGIAWQPVIFCVVGPLIAMVGGLAVMAVRSASPTVAAGRKRKDWSGRKPFRSPALGWSLKCLGLAWIVLIVLDPWAFTQFLAHKVAPHSPTTQFYVFCAFCLPGYLLLYYGYRLCLRTFEPGRHPDPRAPIVYLRGFGDDDRKTFQPTTWPLWLLAAMHGIEADLASPTMKRSLGGMPFWVFHPIKLLRLFLNIDLHSAEELLAAAFRKCGPLIAIGRPGQPLATPGADRMYVPNRQWQQVVLDYLDLCQAVVLQPSNSEGIRWETEQAFTRVDRRRILLSMLNFGKRPADYATFRSWLEEKFGVHLPPAPPSKYVPWFVYFDAEGAPCVQRICLTSPLLWSFTGNAVDMERTFHTFIQGLKGGPRETPREPIARPFQAVASALLPGSVLVLAIYCMIAGGRDAADVRPPAIQEQVWTPPAPSPGDRLLSEARKGKPIEYHGKGINYTLTLPALWKPSALDAETLKKVTEAAKRSGTSIPTPEQAFSLQAEASTGFEGKLAVLDVEIVEEELDLDRLDEIANNLVAARQKILRNMFPDREIKVRLIRSYKFQSGGRLWGEEESRDEIGVAQKGFTTITRFASYNGRTLSLTANILNDDQSVRQLTKEALDSVHFDEAVGK